MRNDKLVISETDGEVLGNGQEAGYEKKIGSEINPRKEVEQNTPLDEAYRK